MYIVFFKVLWEERLCLVYEASGRRKRKRFWSWWTAASCLRGLVQRVCLQGGRAIETRDWRRKKHTILLINCIFSSVLIVFNMNNGNIWKNKMCSLHEYANISKTYIFHTIYQWIFCFTFIFWLKKKGSADIFLLNCPLVIAAYATDGL